MKPSLLISIIHKTRKFAIQFPDFQKIFRMKCEKALDFETERAYNTVVANVRHKKEVNKLNVRKLRAKMIENNFSVEALSNIIGVSKSTFYRKLSEKGENFTIGEANAIARALNFTAMDFSAIFFA
nr:MAG: Protein of unknown function (DUF739) [Bacteriophage sp.]